MNTNARREAIKGLLIAVAAIFLSWGLVYTKVFAAKVTATWSYDYSPEPACSATQTTNCIDHFEVDDITNQSHFLLIQKISNPSKVVGKVDHISTSFKYGPPFGQRTISVVAVGKDSKGERATSNPFAALVTVTIRPGAKTSLVF
jgi:hypothetical protein